MTTVHQSLNQCLGELLAEREEVLVLGEDVVDPYGGAFKVTKGLSTKFPGRVLSTPISEAGITGLSIGLALRGMFPVLEIMFGDFITLCVDQLLNQAAKIHSMYAEPVPVPLVLRTPMGGRRGYGPTHSQTLERLFFGAAGLGVAAVSPLADPGVLLRRAVLDSPRPTVFIENKTLYAKRVLDARSVETAHGMRLALDQFTMAATVSPMDAEPDVTVIAYGGMVPLALEAAERLRREEDLYCELVVEHWLSPCDLTAVKASLARTRRLVTVEEGGADWGWGSGLYAACADVALEAPPRFVGAARRPIPVREDEESETLPQVGDIVRAVVETVDRDYT